MRRFEHQVVVVTGGTRGIGAGITKRFLSEGARVIANYARDDQRALAFKDQLGTLGENLDLRRFDVSKADEVEAFWSYTQLQYPQVDVLINNSGIRRDNLLASMSENQWDEVLQTNLKGTFLMSKGAVLMMMKKRYGRIVHISSVGGHLGLAGQANYAASKAGQVAMAKSLAKEVAKRGITVNCVCPGFIETELLQDLPADQVKSYTQQIPLKRFGNVDEVAAVVSFLASSEASYITGTTVEVSGGL